jgi:type IV pilus assembly protein PilP
MKRLSLALLALTSAAVISACSPASNRDLEQYMAEVQRTTVAGIPPLPELPELAQVHYLGDQKRNPFQRQAMRAVVRNNDSLNCPQPDLKRARVALESFSLEQLTFTGTLRSGNSSYTALVMSNHGRLHRVNRGDYIGPNYGRVSAVTPQQIDIREWVPTGDGCWQQRDAELRISISQRSF